MLTKRCLVVMVLVLLVPDGEAWWKGRRRRRARPPPCRPRDCEVSQWTHWSECSHRCGNIETQFRTRIITAVETCRGTCPYNLRQTRSCRRYACQNGGTPTHVYCTCRTGYTGTCCEQDVNECLTNRNYCSTGGICVNTHGRYRCVCHQGYISSHDGTVCVKQDGKKTSSQDSNLKTYLGCGIGLGFPFGSLMLWLIYLCIKKKCLGQTRETPVLPVQHPPVTIAADTVYIERSSKGAVAIYIDGQNDIPGTVNRCRCTRRCTNTPDQPPPSYEELSIQGLENHCNCD